ncbi:unnamed protein product [Schistocephalus solidus]|uniref:SCHIP-1 domain-containing protein n=1 Tax=Schistocephalus solidus TaxID=70667 RepID=A0A183SDD8_SCHSO|nr:unnamed protein product [Schistocephalus solidus]
MAINFGKLFFQNLVPTHHSSAHTADRDTADSSSVNDYENDYAEEAHANSDFLVDSQNDKLTRALEALRRVIAAHKIQQQQHDQPKVLDYQVPCNTEEEVHSGQQRSSFSNDDQEERLQWTENQQFPARKTGAWRNHRMSAASIRSQHHRKSLPCRQPYSVDLAPTALALSGNQAFKVNERLSKKTEKVSGNAIF